MKTHQKKRSPAGGFTLVQLLIVIAIIAVLAALLFPVLSKAKERSRSVQCLSNSKQLMLAVHMEQFMKDQTAELTQRLPLETATPA